MWLCHHHPTHENAEVLETTQEDRRRDWFGEIVSNIFLANKVHRLNLAGSHQCMHVVQMSTQLRYVTPQCFTMIQLQCTLIDHEKWQCMQRS